MKTLKFLGVAAALALVWGCDSSDDAQPLPSNIATIISQNCGSCHGDPTANDAPYPIVNCDDVLAASPSGGTVLSAIQARINTDDAALVMPPGSPLADGPLDALNAWIADGAPPCE